MTEITRNDGKDDGGSGKSDEDRNSDQENFFMRQALNVAKDALEIGEVPVGCVIVLRDATLITSTSIPKEHIRGSCTSYDMSPSVIISHGSNQVNATRDATRHAEIVAIDRMLARGRSSDQLKLPPDVIPPDVICKSAEDGEPTADSNGRVKYEDSWINIPECSDHWKNSFGWGSGRVYDKDILSQCDLYVTCEPCIMCAAALSMTGIKRVFFGCKNDRFGGCGSLLNLHKPDALPSPKHLGFTIYGGILEEEAIRLLRSFYDRENFHAPAPVRRRKVGRSG